LLLSPVPSFTTGKSPARAFSTEMIRSLIQSLPRSILTPLPCISASRGNQKFNLQDHLSSYTATSCAMGACFARALSTEASLLLSLIRNRGSLCR
jgi:hypothetical protein